MTRVAKQAQSGDLDVQAKVYSNDEVGILARAFNDMILQVRQNNDTLEQRIEERRQELEAEIEENNRLQGEKLLASERKRILADFIQNVSHEFKTPLSIINMQSYLMQRTIDDNSQQARIDKINDQSHNIEALVDQMVMMSRLDQDTVQYVNENILVSSFIEALDIGERPAFEEKGITFTVFVDEQVVYFRANNQLVTDALQSVLHNALKFTQEGGNVTLRAAVKSDALQISITDDGVGIAPDDLPRVFERFYRADLAGTTRGFGLGLPIARRIIERYNGAITLNSRLHVGTSVEIIFPLMPPDTLQ
ncbi:MAG: ATP-binding protein [Chloroflexota bacterium]